MRIPWQELILSGEYTVKYSDGAEEIIRAEYAGGVQHYDRCYGDPLPESIHRHTGYVGTWFSDPIFEGKTECGGELLITALVWENPHPEKKIHTVSYRSAENDISKVILAGIKGADRIK